MVPKIVTQVMAKSLDDLGSFRYLYDWNIGDFLKDGTVDNWAQNLRDPTTLYPEKTQRAARMLVAGSVVAWSEIVATEDATKREEALKQLATILPPVLMESREEGTRASDLIDEPDVTELSNQLARMLLQTNDS